MTEKQTHEKIVQNIFGHRIVSELIDGVMEITLYKLRKDGDQVYVQKCNRHSQALALAKLNHGGRVFLVDIADDPAEVPESRRMELVSRDTIEVAEAEDAAEVVPETEDETDV